MRQETRLAIALKYDTAEDQAPVVVASGRGPIAAAIVDAAQAAGVPLHEDISLAALLARLETGTQIPPELYQAVAQVIAFVWLLDQDRRLKGG